MRQVPLELATGSTGGVHRTAHHLLYCGSPRSHICQYSIQQYNTLCKSRIAQIPPRRYASKTCVLPYLSVPAKYHMFNTSKTLRLASTYQRFICAQPCRVEKDERNER